MRQRGFTMIGILFLVAGLGVAMAALGTMWHTLSKREKERELLFIGEQFRRAIESFWKAPADGVRRLPKDFDELLADPRVPTIRRHLRRVYRDPMTGEATWGTVKEPDGGISGVYSLSEEKPFKTANFPAAADFQKANSYRDWVFYFDAAKADALQAAPKLPPGNRPETAKQPPDPLLD
jgi:type II secretory pathway pseudopilin PulG